MQTTTLLNPSPAESIENTAQADSLLTLIPNKGKLIPVFISGLFSRILFPLFLLHLILEKGIIVEGLSYWIPFVFVASLSGWAFYRFYFPKRNQSRKLSLQLSQKNLFVFWENELLHQIPFSALLIKELGWGPDVHQLLPAIQLQADELAPITIGTMEADSHWADYRKSTECVDFLVESKEMWNQLMAWTGK